MTTMIILFAAILYLLIGALIFNAGEKAIGGREGYLELLEARKSYDPYVLYAVAYCIVVIGWPVVLIISIAKVGRKE